MPIPDLDPASPKGIEWTEHLYIPRMRIFADLLHEVVANEPQRSRLEDTFNLKECPPNIRPIAEVFVPWAIRAYESLRDDGPYEQALANLRASFALTKFAKYKDVSLLSVPSRPILEAPLPTFLGLTAPICVVRYDPATSIVDCIPRDPSPDLRDVWSAKRTDPIQVMSTKTVRLPSDAPLN